MEFPELGDHCAVATCSQLDFLPFTCDACGKTFCKDHREYEKHECEQQYTKDITVPVCPLCSQPVPTRRGGDPNVSVDEHIANDCQSDKAKKVYSNKCRYPGCKKKELVPVVCENCGKNYCIRHRLGPDHNCTQSAATIKTTPVRSTSSTFTQASRSSNKAPQATFMSHSGAEMNKLRMERQQQQPRQQQNRSNYPPLQGMSEDEALAMAMAASLGQQAPQQSSSSTQGATGASGYDEDEALARAVAASLQDEKHKKQSHHRQSQQRQPQQRQQKKSDGDSCVIS